MPNEPHRYASRIVYTDVEQAANELVRRGKLRPSQKDILAYLGRGSEPTIARHLTAWYRERLDPDRVPPSAIPEEVQKDMVQLWQKSLNLAETRWEKAREQQQKLLKVAEEKEQQAADQVKQQQIILTQLENTQTRLQDELIETRQQLAVAEEKQQQAKQTIQAIETQMAEAEQRHQATLQTMEQQQQAANQQLNYERERHEQTENRLLQEIDDLRQERKQLYQQTDQLQELLRTNQVVWQNKEIDYCEQIARLVAEKEALQQQYTQLKDEFSVKNAQNKQQIDHLSQNITIYKQEQVIFKQKIAELEQNQINYPTLTGKANKRLCIDLMALLPQCAEFSADPLLPVLAEAKKTLAHLRQNYQIVVVSPYFYNEKEVCRIKQWLVDNEITIDAISAYLVPAYAYLGYRVFNIIRWSSIDELLYYGKP